MCLSSTGVALAALTLVWIGRASADEGGASPAATISKAVSNVATSRADAVDAGNEVCTASPQFNNLPNMSETFAFGGTASRPVIVLFQGSWRDRTEGSSVSIRLTIDGVVQSGPAFVGVDHRPIGEPPMADTSGFNFVSDMLAPGTHTATIQWADNGVGPFCVTDRSLIVLHK